MRDASRDGRTKERNPFPGDDVITEHRARTSRTSVAWLRDKNVKRARNVNQPCIRASYSPLSLLLFSFHFHRREIATV